MPQFSLAPAQVDALTTALLALTDRAHDLPMAIDRAGEAAFELPARGQGRKAHGMTWLASPAMPSTAAAATWLPT